MTAGSGAVADCATTKASNVMRAIANAMVLVMLTLRGVVLEIVDIFFSFLNWFEHARILQIPPASDMTLPAMTATQKLTFPAKRKIGLSNS